MQKCKPMPRKTTPRSAALSRAHALRILDSIAAGVFTIDLEMRVRYFNRTAEKITGIRASEAIGQFCSDILRSDDCERHCSLKAAIRTGKEIVDRHCTILRRDGRTIPISLTAAVLRDRRGKIVGGVESFRDLSTLAELEKELRRSYTFQDIVSKNHRMLGLFEVLPPVAKSDSTVLIQGPSGSGKELVARAIHNLSLRSGGPFVAVNCGALPDTLLESELFGYVRGAFTDARHNRKGRFALAQRGTLFLDEVESLSPATQVKLLRVLQEREYEPLGSSAAVKADVRVVAATKEDLGNLVEAGRFRDDLFFRLNVVRLDLPSLAQRREDIPLLVERFIEKFNGRMGRTIRGVADDVTALLMQHPFPGNVRQLENIIEHAFIMCRGDVIQRQHLPPDLGATPEPSPGRYRPLDVVARQAVEDALRRNGGNAARTAADLGVSRTTLWRMRKKFGLL